MTNDLDALLAAVRATPADDLPRLVVADWLEEHGQEERAELIREMIAGQVSGGRFRAVADYPATDRPYWERLGSTGTDGPSGPRLAGGANSRWADRIREHVLGDPARWVDAGLWLWAERGFVGKIEGPLIAFLEHAGAVFREHPVAAVELMDASPVSMSSSPGGTVRRHNYAILVEGVDTAHAETIVRRRLPTFLLGSEARWEYQPGQHTFSVSVTTIGRTLSEHAVEYGRRLAGVESERE